MEYLATFLLYIGIGILLIILFIKIWIMTNDVKELKNHFVIGGKLVDKINLLILMGENEKAKDLLRQYFYKEVYKCYQKDGGNALTNEVYMKKYQENLDLIEKKYTPFFESLGMDVPNLQHNDFLNP